MPDIPLDIGDAARNKLPGVPANYTSTDPGAGFEPLLMSIMTGVMIVASLLVFLYFVWGAIEWITSGGDSAKVQKARDKITQAAIGIIILSSTFAIFKVLQNFLALN